MRVLQKINFLEIEKIFRFVMRCFRLFWLIFQKKHYFWVVFFRDLRRFNVNSYKLIQNYFFFRFLSKLISSLVNLTKFSFAFSFLTAEHYANWMQIYWNRKSRFNIDYLINNNRGNYHRHIYFPCLCFLYYINT